MKNLYDYRIVTSFIKRDNNVDYSKEDTINALSNVINNQLYIDIDDARSSGRNASFEFVSHSLASHWL